MGTANLFEACAQHGHRSVKRGSGGSVAGKREKCLVCFICWLHDVGHDGNVRMPMMILVASMRISFGFPQDEGTLVSLVRKVRVFWRRVVFSSSLFSMGGLDEFSRKLIRNDYLQQAKGHHIKFSGLRLPKVI